MKILILSHNPISTYNNMGKTLSTLFSQFEKSELCQFYIYPSTPDTDKCNSYYRTTDYDILTSFVKFKVNGSVVFPETEQHTLYDNSKAADFNKKQGARSDFKNFIRDCAWSLSHYFTKDLSAWLEREAPTAIFLSPGYAKFIYDIALKISKKLNIPIITYICDDYYFVNEPKGLLGKLQLFLLRKKTDKLMKKTSHLITICDDIKELYEKKFGVPASVVMTGNSYGVSESISVSDAPKAICYFGNISCNRHVSLAEIGRALDRLNETLGASYSLKIYTGEKNPDILRAFDGIKSISLCGFISGREFEETLRVSDMLLHTEAFDEKSIDLVKHSVSTKIADSLASGIPLFAYGPKEVASMEHLIKNDAAITCTSQDELEKTLSAAFDDADLRRRAAENGLETARKYHDAAKNSREIKAMFSSL